MQCLISIPQAGNHVPDDVVSSTIQLISETRGEQAYAVGELWRHLSVAQLEFQPVIQVATWCIGEFGDLLLNGMMITQYLVVLVCCVPLACTSFYS